MAKRTEKCKYPSPSSPGEFVTAAQYIVELICQNKAEADEVTALPVRFWRLPEWAKYFRSQTPAANKLLKKYDELAIIRALQDYRSRKTYSLRAPWLVRIIEEKQKEVVAEAAKREAAMTNQKEYNEQTATSKPRKRRSTGSLLGKLTEIENGEEGKSENKGPVWKRKGRASN